MNEGPLSAFKTVPQLCIPMTLPVKFVIAQANKYHACRNLFKELDQYLNIAQKSVFSDNKIQLIRQQISGFFLGVFEENKASIQLLASIIQQKFPNSSKLILKQSPTIQKKSDFPQNYQVESHSDLIDQIQQIWLNLYETGSLMARRDNQIVNLSTPLKTYQTQMSILVQECVESVDYSYELWNYSDTITVEIRKGVSEEQTDRNSDPLKVRMYKKSKEFQILSFFDQSTLKSSGTKVRVDYTKDSFYQNTEMIQQVCNQLLEVSNYILANKSQKSVNKKDYREKNLSEIKEELEYQDYSDDDIVS